MKGVYSVINKLLQTSSIPPCQKVLVQGQNSVPVCLLGDAAYPLLPYVMKEYAGGGRTVEEKFFSQKLSSARITIESAFGRLKARFGALRREMDMQERPSPCNLQLLYSAQLL